MAQRLFDMPQEKVRESTWQSRIQDVLNATGWHSMSVMPLRTRQGWRTGVTTIGWPDIVALRGKWIVAIECKGPRTAIGPGQIGWLGMFSELPTGRAWILRPQDSWEEIVEWLYDPEHAPRQYGWQSKESA